MRISDWSSDVCSSDLIRWAIKTDQYDAETDAVLGDILAAEISPELVPAGDDGAVQSTESLIGPYELHDFFLYYIVRHGLPPSTVAFLAWHAWRDVDAGRWPIDFPEAGRRAYDLETIRRWLEVFLKRFFGFSQFKRSALPNGPKVSAGGDRKSTRLELGGRRILNKKTKES